MDLFITRVQAIARGDISISIVGGEVGGTAEWISDQALMYQLTNIHTDLFNIVEQMQQFSTDDIVQFCGCALIDQLLDSIRRKRGLERLPASDYEFVLRYAVDGKVESNDMCWQVLDAAFKAFPSNASVKNVRDSFYQRYVQERDAPPNTTVPNQFM